MERHSQRWNSSKDLIDGVTQLRISRRVHHRASHLDHHHQCTPNFLLFLRIIKMEKTSPSVNCNHQSFFLETSVIHNLASVWHLYLIIFFESFLMTIKHMTLRKSSGKVVIIQN